MNTRKLLLRLTDIASRINAAQHAGTTITPAMWSKLYQTTNEARALLHSERVPDATKQDEQVVVALTMTQANWLRDTVLNAGKWDSEQPMAADIAAMLEDVIVNEHGED